MLHEYGISYKNIEDKIKNVLVNQLLNYISRVKKRNELLKSKEPIILKRKLRRISLRVKRGQCRLRCKMNLRNKKIWKNKIITII